MPKGVFFSLKISTAVYISTPQKTALIKVFKKVWSSFDIHIVYAFSTKLGNAKLINIPSKNVVIRLNANPTDNSEIFFFVKSFAKYAILPVNK